MKINLSFLHFLFLLIVSACASLSPAPTVTPQPTQTPLPTSTPIPVLLFTPEGVNNAASDRFGVIAGDEDMDYVPFDWRASSRESAQFELEVTSENRPHESCLYEFNFTPSATNANSQVPIEISRSAHYLSVTINDLETQDQIAFTEFVSFPSECPLTIEISSSGLGLAPNGMITSGQVNTDEVWQWIQETLENRPGRPLTTIRKLGNIIEHAQQPQFDPSSTNLLLISSNHEQAAVVDLVNNTIRFVLDHPNIKSARYSSDGHLILTAGGDTAIVWDAQTGEELNRLTTPDEADINAAIFSRDDSLIVAFGWFVRIWEIESGELLLDHTMKEPARGGDISPDGRLVFYWIGGGIQSRIRTLDAMTGEQQAVRASEQQILQTCFSANGSQIHLVLDALIPIPSSSWDSSTLQGIPVNGFVSCDYTDDGQLGIIPHTASAIIFDAITGEPLLQLSAGTDINAVTISPNGQFAALATVILQVQLWDISSSIN
jgi:hypothetical protein